MFLTKTKNMFPENLKIRKFQDLKIKWKSLTNPGIFEFWDFSKKCFLFWSRTYRKNKNLCIIINNIKPVRVQFTSPNYLRRTLGQGERLGKSRKCSIFRKTAKCHFGNIHQKWHFFTTCEARWDQISKVRRSCVVDRGIGGSPLDVLRAPEAIGTAAGTSNTLQTAQ